MPTLKRQPTKENPASAPPAPAMAPKLSGPEVAGVGADVTDFISADQKSDENYIQPPRKFKDQVLADYSTGVRLLWLNLMNDGDSSQMLGACMIWLLIQLETFRVFAAAKLSDPEAVWDAAHTSLLLLVDNRVTCRSKVINWATRLKKKELNKCVTLSNEILDQADREEIESDPETNLPTAEGNGLPADAILTQSGN